MTLLAQPPDLVGFASREEQVPLVGPGV